MTFFRRKPKPPVTPEPDLTLEERYNVAQATYGAALSSIEFALVDLELAVAELDRLAPLLYDRATADKELADSMIGDCFAIEVVIAGVAEAVRKHHNSSVYVINH